MKQPHSNSNHNNNNNNIHRVAGWQQSELKTSSSRPSRGASNAYSPPHRRHRTPEQATPRCGRGCGDPCDSPLYHPISVRELSVVARRFALFPSPPVFPSVFWYRRSTVAENTSSLAASSSARQAAKAEQPNPLPQDEKNSEFAGYEVDDAGSNPSYSVESPSSLPLLDFGRRHLREDTYHTSRGGGPVRRTRP